MNKPRSKRARFLWGLVAGVIAAVTTGLVYQWEFALLVGWDAFALVVVGLIWFDFLSHSGSQTATVAKRDDMGGFTLDMVVVFASIASLGAVIILISAKDAGLARLVFGLLSVIVSWTTVHTVYALRYTSAYYRGDHDGGVAFNDRAQPRFLDFAYLAFTIGMTYQVSDTTLTSHEMRRIALGHALISFVFGVAIIATAINIVAGIVGQ